MLVKKKTKILGIYFFVLLLVVILYLSVSTERKTEKNIIKVIQLVGNNLLRRDEYLKFAKLDNRDEYSNLTPFIVKDRLLKHPYIRLVNVKFIEKNVLYVEIIEKTLNALVRKDSSNNFITSSFEVLPIVKNTRFINLPVITNLSIDNYKIFQISKNPETKLAFMVLDFSKLVNTDLRENISTLDFNKNGNIRITLKNCLAPILIGNDNILAKIYYLSKSYDEIIAQKNAKYIDLRSKGYMYIGFNNIVSDTVKIK